MYIFSAILITFPLPPLAKGLCLSAKIVAFYSGADNGSAVAFHLCTFGALFLHFYFTINTDDTQTVSLKQLAHRFGIKYDINDIFTE